VTLSNRNSSWSRANFKETLPEVPSRLSTTFLEEYMENNILAHYRALGCVIPPELTPVRVIEGRPFINVTLFQSLVAQLGGDPRDVIERMGGQGAVSEHLPSRLPFWKLLRAGLLVEISIRHAIRTASSWFAQIKQLAAAVAREAPEYSKYPVDVLLQQVQSLGNLLKRCDLTFAIVAGVGQGFQILGGLLPCALGPDWRTLLNRALQGQGTIISAKQIELIQQLARLAAEEAAVRDYFRSERTEWREFQTMLAGTAFLGEFEAFLAEYGHRGIGESDFTAPRHADRPDYLMTVIRNHLQTLSPNLTPPDLSKRQEQIRNEAISEIRRRLGWRPFHRLLFRWTYRRLTHCLSLREANRHHVMYFSAMVRDLMLAIGGHLVDQGQIGQRGDVFFLTADEIRSLTDHSSRDWRQLVEMRRQERAAHMNMTVPDDVGPESRAPVEREPATDRSGILRGIPISTGRVQGPVRVIRSPDDLRTVERGDILVVSVIDPGLAPLFGLVGGLIAEMGGTLSHGAIIAREYGLPTIANVHDAMQILRTGDILDLDATHGELRRLG
jgi:pyruvate,water dikinase